MVDISHSQAVSSGFRAVGWANASLGASDLALAKGLLGESIDNCVQGEV